MNFGRHSGKEIDQLPASYLEWVYSEHMPALREIEKTLGFTPAKCRACKVIADGLCSQCNGDTQILMDLLRKNIFR